MALIIIFHNQQKVVGPLLEDADYRVTVLVGDGGPNSRLIAEGRVEHHQRSLGWKALVKRDLEENP